MSDWPKVIDYFLHCDKDTNWDTGEDLGLSEEAIKENFRGCCYEIKFTLEVYENGKAYATHFESVELPKKICVT